ncbi:hypothetical protein J6590_091918 [Homalodisca vitripennis]|nr:hypothetical protein J6590_091918 [Homalodisca vitripennis]
MALNVTPSSSKYVCKHTVPTSDVESPKPVTPEGDPEDSPDLPRPTPTYDNKTMPSMLGTMKGPSGPSKAILDLENRDSVNLLTAVFDAELIESNALQSNLYAQQSVKRFTPKTSDQMNLFFGLKILMGINKCPSYRNYWSNDEDLNDPYISSLMPVNHFG